MQNNFPNDKNNNQTKNDSKNDIHQKHEQSNKIMSLMRKQYYFFQDYNIFE